MLKERKKGIPTHLEIANFCLNMPSFCTSKSALLTSKHYAVICKLTQSLKFLELIKSCTLFEFEYLYQWILVKVS